MAKRDPRKDPAPGDVLSSRFSEHKVLEVRDGVVYYLDERLRDYVPIERWRKWYVGKRGITITKASP